jgi:hypothetical protein
MECGRVSDRTTPVSDIRLSLEQIKRETTKPNRFAFVRRKESIDCLANLGFSIKAAQNEIMSLTYQDYDRGPLPDHDQTRPGSIWEFIKNVDGIEVYIKLKLDPDRGCVCLSLHQSEGPVKLRHRHDP